MFIAMNGAERPVSAKEIAEVQGVAPRYLEQMLQKLCRAGILRSVRGPTGGYVLAKERRKVSLRELCDALREEQEQSVTPIAEAVLLPAWKKAEQAMGEVLASVTLADLCSEASAKKLGRRAGAQDFTI